MKLSNVSAHCFDVKRVWERVQGKEQGKSTHQSIYILVAIVPNCISCISAAAAQCRPATENKPQLFISCIVFFMNVLTHWKVFKPKHFWISKVGFSYHRKYFWSRSMFHKQHILGRMYLIKESERKRKYEKQDLWKNLWKGDYNYKEIKICFWNVPRPI